VRHALIMAAYCAGRTNRIKLGTGTCLANEPTLEEILEHAPIGDPERSLRSLLMISVASGQATSVP
jgi:hypothetical protein